MATSRPSENSDPAVLRGKITDWNTAKGFGFADDGRRRIFVHIRDFSERIKTPEVGDSITFTLGNDAQGRSCGKNITLQGTGGRLRIRHGVLLAVLLVAPSLAIWRLDSTINAQRLAGWLVIASIGTFGLYAWDKRRAQRGGDRTPENVLHLMELLGGWPGALLAQKAFRHKSSKISYQVTFWLIVALHQYVCIDSQLNWQLYTHVKQWLPG